MEATMINIGGNIGVVYRDGGKENGNCCLGFRI